STKSDGHIFSYIHFGGVAIMPRYGYKLSPREHWDIVNYIRWMQKDFSKLLPQKTAAVNGAASTASEEE
ncbi:MAG: cytochrome c, partial [Bdellovibrionales bacterium]|nr:cytochrome c [Bdellovibrionales bacterium]